VAVGPLIGGVLTESLGWEWIFFVNVPVGALAIALALRYIDEGRDPNAAGIDWPGLVTFSGGLFLLVFALIRGNPEGWGSTIIVSMLIGAVVLLVAFFVIESRVPNAMLDLSLFRVPTFAGASIAAFGLSSSMFAMFLYLTLYIQNGLHYSPLQAGLRFLPITITAFVVAPIAGRLSSTIPIRVLLGVGLVLVSAGLLLMHGLTVHSGWTALLAGFLVAGVGIGLVNPSLATTAVGVVPPQRSGMASGINNTFRQVGIATGIAALGAVFQSTISDKVTSGLGALVGGRAAALADLVVNQEVPRRPRAGASAFARSRRRHRAVELHRCVQRLAADRRRHRAGRGDPDLRPRAHARLRGLAKQRAGAGGRGALNHGTPGLVTDQRRVVAAAAALVDRRGRVEEDQTSNSAHHDDDRVTSTISSGESSRACLTAWGRSPRMLRSHGTWRLTVDGRPVARPYHARARQAA
jgi:predicted MFS family arabinose efflux permease